MKFRIMMVSAFALASAMVVSAGQIQIGGLNGLTTLYESGGCPGCTDDYNYDEVLFNGLTNGGPAPVPYAGYTTGAAQTGQIKDTNSNAVNADGAAGVTFNMINDGTTNVGACTGVVGQQQCGIPESNNYWTLDGYSSFQFIKVPIGVYGVTDLWTMLNSEYASASSVERSAIVELFFGPTPTGASTETVELKINNTGDLGSGAAGQIQNAIICSAADPCNGVNTPASGPMGSSANFTPVVPPSPAGLSVNVVTDNLFSYAYNTNGNGTLVLNDQGFLLGTLNFGGGNTNLNMYLEDIKIFANGGASGAPSEALALSAITVDAIPEPSTVIMFISGLGAIGFARFRRRKS